jgi:hypothetical protein
LNCKVPILVVCLLFFLLNSAVPQSFRYSIALPYTGLSAYSAGQPDLFSFTANQAALAAVKQAGIGIYGERRFLLKEISSYILAALLPAGRGNFGIQLNYSGFKDFNENKIGLAYARKLGEKLSVGTQFNHYGYRIPGYSSASFVNFEAGVLLHFSEKLNGGFHVSDPVKMKTINAGIEQPAAVYSMGLGYDASANFFVGTEIIKEEDKPVNVITGIQYHFAKQFFAKAGLMSQSSLLFAGVGIGWANLRLDIAGSYHPQLGFSPGLLLLTNFRKRK